MTTEIKTAEAKQEFLRAFEAKAGNVKVACQAMGMPRSKYYAWRRTDLAFAEAVDDVLEGLKDFAESKLMVNIQQGKEASIFFFLKCKAKDRGYIERVDINHNATLTLEAVLAESWKIAEGKKVLGEG